MPFSQKKSFMKFPSKQSADALSLLPWTYLLCVQVTDSPSAYSNLSEAAVYMMSLCWSHVKVASQAWVITSLDYRVLGGRQPVPWCYMSFNWESDRMHSSISSYCGRDVENWRQCGWSVTVEEGPQTELIPRVTERCIPGSLTLKLRSVCRPTACVYSLVTACSWVRYGRRREPSHVWKPDWSAARPGVRLQPVSTNSAFVTHDLWF